MPHGAVPFPFGDCRICNDKATGFHYGVATCEGCKGFFKRSIPKGDKYTCFFGGHCNITPFNRNRCKACRFKRCLDNGMAIDAVKMGRIPKVEKERALLETRMQSKSENISTMDVCESPEDLESSLTNPWPTSETKPGIHLPSLDNAGSSQSLAGSSNIISGQGLRGVMTHHGMGHSKQGGKLEQGTGHSLRGIALEQGGGHGLQGIVPDQAAHHVSLHGDSSDLMVEGPFRDWKKPEIKAPVSRQTSLPSSLELRPDHNAHWNSASGHLNAKKSLSATCSLTETFFDDHFQTNDTGQTHQNRNDAIFSLNNSNPNSRLNPSQASSGHQPLLNIQGPRLNSPQTSVSHPPSFHMPGSQRLNLSKTSTGHLPMFNLSSASAQVKTEPEVDDCQFFSVRETVSCDNPFAQQPMFNNSPHCVSKQPMLTYQNPTENMSGFLNISTPWEGTNHNSENPKNISGNSYGYENKKGSADVVKLEAGMDKKMDYRANLSAQPPSISHRSSYSPDIIKVLLDQVGGERIKGMEQQIMTTIAKTYGPEEYEATKELLTMYTQSAEDKKDSQFNYTSHDSTHNVFNNTSKLFNSTQDIFSNAHVNRPSHYQAAESCGKYPKMSSNHMSQLSHTSLQPSRSSCHNELKLSPILDDMDILDEPSETQWFGQSGGGNQSMVSLKPNRKPSSRTVGDLLLSAMDSSHERFDHSHNTVAVDQACAGDYDLDVIDLRSSDKASVGSRSQNSDKDSTSPDSGHFDDLTMSESILTLSTSYEKHMVDNIEKYRIMKYYVDNNKTLPVHPLTPEGKEVVYNLLIKSIPHINKSIIGLCQDVPGFATLAKGDKELLIKRGYYDIWMLTNSKFFHDNESYLQLDDGTFYTRAWMERILNPLIAEKIVSFAKRFNQLELSDLELSVLCAIQLTAPGNEALELERPESIQQMNSHYVDLLVEEVSKRRPNNCSRILVDIFRLLPDLREINLLQREIIASLSTETCPEKIEYKPEAPPLADIPETDLASLNQS